MSRCEEDEREVEEAESHPPSLRQATVTQLLNFFEAGSANSIGWAGEAASPPRSFWSWGSSTPPAKTALEEQAVVPGPEVETRPGSHVFHVGTQFKGGEGSPPSLSSEDRPTAEWPVDVIHIGTALAEEAALTGARDDLFVGPSRGALAGIASIGAGVVGRASLSSNESEEDEDIDLIVSLAAGRQAADSRPATVYEVGTVLTDTPEQGEPTRASDGRAVKTIVTCAAGGAAIAGSAGGIIGATSGGAIGAAIGVLPALFTCGLSIPIGAAIGSTVGLATGTAIGGGYGLVSGAAVGSLASRTQRSLAMSRGGSA